MKENVGRFDQSVRSFAGPLLLVLGYGWLGGREGRGLGLAAMIGGAMLTETAMTRTCPLNELLGIDTTRWDRPALAEPEAELERHYGDAILEQVEY